jgi:hypothetical protein
MRFCLHGNRDRDRDLANRRRDMLATVSDWVNEGKTDAGAESHGEDLKNNYKDMHEHGRALGDCRVFCA